jgi:hypothetical protein
MTDHPEPFARPRQGWRSNRLQQAGAVGSVLRVIPKNPFLLIGAAVVGVVGVLAWRNRERIAEKSAPLIEDAKAKGHELIEDAKVLGQELIDEAKAKTQALGEKAARVRRRATSSTTPATTPPELPPELH